MWLCLQALSCTRGVFAWLYLQASPAVPWLCADAESRLHKDLLPSFDKAGDTREFPLASQYLVANGTSLSGSNEVILLLLSLLFHGSWHGRRRRRDGVAEDLRRSVALAATTGASALARDMGGRGWPADKAMSRRMAC